VVEIPSAVPMNTSFCTWEQYHSQAITDLHSLKLQKLFLLSSYLFINWWLCLYINANANKTAACLFRVIKVVNVSRFISSTKYQIFGWTYGVICICYISQRCNWYQRYCLSKHSTCISAVPKSLSIDDTISACKKNPMYSQNK
jgi:hypothetical protein